MPRANDDVSIDRATRKLAAIVRARVFNRIERAVDVEHRNEHGVDFDLSVVAVSNRVGRRDLQPGHIIPVCNRAASDIIV